MNTTPALQLPEPVRTLLARTGHPTDIPDTGAPLTPGWLPTLTNAILALLTDANPADAARSYTGHGHTDLYLAQHGEDTLYLRTGADNHSAPRQAPDKSAHLTLTGTATLTAYTTTERADADHPQYLREFRPESAYFCYPGTLHTTELADSTVQLVVTRGPLTPYGTALTSDQYLDTLKTASDLLTHTLQPAPTTHALDNARSHLPTGQQLTER
ncbi:hypothetical protein [Kitasatospora sp. NPDC059327]|uniref:hypothetical protein n=1 Tax=Kitasatospora sp. NPDC059327 TaxID=3346803 RepID=UPI0036C1CBB5